ncbi:hypothetical protein [uncultured Parasphingopyxis sp.]|uniref:hypothetical protein n=1 Tax=uncultured Parasphingopyxis sp. TaxID=1547918 RepID=UPI00263432FB|nr:hypothetical protein [uncultured Parasphingopyxis sp.]
MEASRLGGALLAAVATGVGIMVPYTFKTMSTPLLAVIWALLVFAGIVGLVLALKPESQPPVERSPVITTSPPRRPLIDPEFVEEFKPFIFMATFMVGFVIFNLVMQALFRVMAWMATL